MPGDCPDRQPAARTTAPAGRKPPCRSVTPATAAAGHADGVDLLLHDGHPPGRACADQGVENAPVVHLVVLGEIGAAPDAGGQQGLCDRHSPAVSRRALRPSANR